MNLFKREKKMSRHNSKASNQSVLSEMALKVIQDGVIMTDRNGIIEYINPAAVIMTGCGSATNAIGLDYALVIKLESKEGRELSENENPLIQAIKTGQPLEAYKGNLILSDSNKRVPVALSVILAEGSNQDRIITFRNIEKELAEEGEQTEFISTASHEMRTPVATIDGYLSLCLNPQTATIDDRARGYLSAAQAASKHLGKLFQDLLDVTKLDDGRVRPHFEPVEMVSLVEQIANDHAARAKESKLNYTFGSDSNFSFSENRRLEQVVYGFVDVNFIREILDNLIDNAIKYTPEGGSIYVNVRGDGDRILINVTDSGMGISADDLTHIFQKFYRVDNSDTRTIGGTGLGLYMVKQRAEAMGGKVWAESAFGEGSTFYVSLPRITADEYEKRMIVVRNQQMQEQLMKQNQVSQTPPPQPIQSQPTPIAPPSPTSQLNPILPSNPSPTSPPPIPSTRTSSQILTQPTQSPQSPQPPQPSQPTQPTQSPQPPRPPQLTQPPQPSQPTQSITNSNLNGEVK